MKETATASNPRGRCFIDIPVMARLLEKAVRAVEQELMTDGGLPGEVFVESMKVGFRNLFFFKYLFSLLNSRFC